MIITLDQVAVYFLIVSRLVGLVVLDSFFGDKRVFAMVKMVFVLWLAGLMIFAFPLSPHIPHSPVSFMLSLMVEFLIGASIGFITNLMIAGIEFAGSLMDTQAGLSVASLLDPSTGQNAALFQQFLKWVALIMFLQVDGHHLVLSALYQSFNILPLGAPVNLAEGSMHMMKFGTDLFLVAVQLSAPILLVIFLVDFSFGLLNRVAEQINVFQLGFQVKPLVSLIIFLAIIPGLVQSVITLLDMTSKNIMTLLFHLQGGL